MCTWIGILNWLYQYAIGATDSKPVLISVDRCHDMLILSSSHSKDHHHAPRRPDSTDHRRLYSTGHFMRSFAVLAALELLLGSSAFPLARRQPRRGTYQPSRALGGGGLLHAAVSLEIEYDGALEVVTLTSAACAEKEANRIGEKV